MASRCRRRYGGLLVDIDGVVWRGGKPIGENVEGINALRGEGARIVFVTNNATRSRRLYARMLTEALGWSVAPDHVVTSAYALAEAARRRYGELRVYVVGGPGLVEELAAAGHLVVTEQEADACTLDAVAVGLDWEVTYSKIRRVVKALLSCRTLFLVANEDPAIPVEDGIAPGAGSIVRAIVTASGREPDMIAGKPSSVIAEEALRRLGLAPEQVLVVGDRADTDVEMARRVGADSLLVETGVPHGKTVEPEPTYRYSNILEFARLPVCS
ncbi:MAG: HAD-IIA family hydrolase [Thermoproteota archaeon]